MAADFLGAMFEGIGKTFEAGGKVNVAKIDRQIAQLGYKGTLLTLDDADANAKLSYVNDAQQQEAKLLAIALAACIIGVVIFALIFQK